MLDVGCGKAHLSGKLAREGNQVVGIEFNSRLAKQARMQGVRVEEKDAEEVDYGALGKFDVVMLGDVLEHLREPQKTLEKIAKASPGAVFFLQIPNVAYWRNRLEICFGNFDYRKYGVFDDTHLRFFTLKTAKKMLEDAGLEIMEMVPTGTYAPRGVADAVCLPLARLWPQMFAYGFAIRAVALNRLKC